MSEEKRVLVIVPFAFDESGIGNREAQLEAVELGGDIVFEFKGVKAGPAILDSHHDAVLGDMALFEVGIEAQNEGYDAVCIDTMSDSGVNALRSVLDIPVIGPGRASYCTALMLGDKFSVVTQWDGWKPLYKKGVKEAGLEDKLASIRSINVLPDPENLLGGKEEVVFPKLVSAAMAAIEEDGAEVILLGSTTMHQAAGHIAENIPVPLINPGPLTYKLAEFYLGLGISQSRKCYPSPAFPNNEMVHAMMDGAKAAAINKANFDK
ncbi:MAG: hydrogenase expression protein HupH [Rhodospirillaceae bacterium]|nr:hydrogenase expression protein HupH [Rhodospirillaceae bacterium]|tara:strand:- start:3843 stop:4637 length:795 start_codon:yes stop_codon:yes gene_type:complete